jgi:hypothetical protein
LPKALISTITLPIYVAPKNINVDEIFYDNIRGEISSERVELRQIYVGSGGFGSPISRDHSAVDQRHIGGLWIIEILSFSQMASTTITSKRETMQAVTGGWPHSFANSTTRPTGSSGTFVEMCVEDNTWPLMPAGMKYVSDNRREQPRTAKALKVIVAPNSSVCNPPETCLSVK